ncbi:amidohydrolase [Ruegeria arenilitoris]|uniref:amidohydrolase n=1 Tax=Ruegeria arenilitoris TaxID=1173585 RepID=UPI001C2C7ABA|nr:amidohydrolase [Ruegeria arenilitoris]
MGRMDSNLVLTELDKTMRQWRHHLHRNPEFGFEEKETVRFVAQRLREFGIEDIETAVGNTGIVATLRFGNGDRTVALRADMDCLKIHETTNLSYSSEKPGLMHACGHDGHTTILLGTAAILASEGGFDGTVKFVFQPAEEWGQGMKAMIRDGLGSRIPFDEIYGLHNKPGLPVGSFEVRPGPFMGAEDGFRIVVRGNGGHASRPHDCRDAILCACSIVSELQTIVARAIDPAELAVVSVTSIQGDNIKNAIASEAIVEGDCRHFDDNVSLRIEETMSRIAEGIANAHGCSVEIKYDRVFIPLVNDDRATEHALKAAEAVFGSAKTNPDAPRMGASEDFARALRIAPGAFVNIGNGDSAPLHNPEYDFNDDALAQGVKWFVELVRQRLPVTSSRN